MASGFLHIRMRRNSMCSSFEAFLHVLRAWTCSVVRSASSSSRQFSPPLPSLFPLFIQCGRCLFPFPVWGFMAGLPGFASHERSLHLGAGCHQGKLLDVSGCNLQLAMQLSTMILTKTHFYSTKESGQRWCFPNTRESLHFLMGSTFEWKKN